ncbi:MAG TPA: hypothetical protein DIT58_06125, partial [Porticoccaceae bacterium]|nr:hypothetical protein [Porticoccaceae bacterium]
MSAPITTARLRYSFFSNWCGIAFGTLESALQRVIDGIGSKILSFSGHSLRDQVPTQEWIVNSKAALRAARAGHLEAMGAVWQAAQYDEEVPLRLRAQEYAFYYYAIDVIRDTISRLYSRGARAAFQQGHPVERTLRN